MPTNPNPDETLPRKPLTLTCRCGAKNERARLECWANAEFWAGRQSGIDAGLAMGAEIARGIADTYGDRWHETADETGRIINHRHLEHVLAEKAADEGQMRRALGG